MTNRATRQQGNAATHHDDPSVPSGRQVIERATTPTGEWQLQRREGHYEIICNGVFLMASYNRESDRALARLALARVSGDELRILVGGLGIGFTAQAALEDQRVAVLDVVEIEPLVVGWHRTFFADLCNHALDDPRVNVIQDDLFDVRLRPGSYDAMLLDTDNGPEWLARDANERLYRSETIEHFLSALRPGGVIAFWSAQPATEFAEVLADVAGRVQAFEVPEDIAPGRSATAWIYLTRRDPAVALLRSRALSRRSGS